VYASERVLVDAYQTEDKALVKLLAKTIWGEARNQGDIGMEAVCHVILNRVGQRETWSTVEQVVLSPKQFSVWNEYDVNYGKLREDISHKKEFKKALQIAQKCLYDDGEDITNGSNHYHAKRVQPAWASKMDKIITIGDHIFYKEREKKNT